MQFSEELVVWKMPEIYQCLTVKRVNIPYTKKLSISVCIVSMIKPATLCVIFFESGIKYELLFIYK